MEPAHSEATAACLAIIREALDEAARRGVPHDAVRAFLLGHINIELAVIFGEAGNPLSDGALLAIEHVNPAIFQSDWKKMFEPEEVCAGASRRSSTPSARMHKVVLRRGRQRLPTQRSVDLVATSPGQRLRCSI